MAYEDEKPVSAGNAQVAQVTPPVSDASEGLSDSLQGDQSEKEKFGETSPKDFRFWMIIAALSITLLLAALESTVVSTALPTIAGDLDAGELYVWFINSFFLTSTCFVPLYGQFSDVFGRRWMMIGGTAIFLLGSGISGGANSPAMLIAGRTLQGLGGGGINVMVEIIVSDLLPLRERGKYMGIIFAVFSIGTSLGPVIGGLIVTNISWRWVFYINLPIGGVGLLMLIVFLHVKYKPYPLAEKVRRIDYGGNIVLILSLVSILIGLSWGGTKYSWRDYHVLVPLILGLVGMIGFHSYEAAPWVKEPVLPPRVFGNRTSAAALVVSFLAQLLLILEVFFMPVYFQSVKLVTPTIAGVDFLPSVIICIPASMAAGFALSKWGRYRPIHAVGFALQCIGFGLFSLLNENSSTAEWAIFQIIAALGIGVLMTSTLSAVQAELPDKDIAASSAAWTFMRQYGAIWGSSIPAAVFNSRFGDLAAQRISDPTVLARFSGGAAYSSISPDYLNTLAPSVKNAIISTYSDSIQLVWYASLAFCLLGFLVVWVQKEIKLREENEGEFGLESKKVEDAETAKGKQNQ